MKSVKEIYEALLAGEKVARVVWERDWWIGLDAHGNLINECGNPWSVRFDNPEDWVIWAPSKKKVWVNLYRYADLCEHDIEMDYDCYVGFPHNTDAEAIAAKSSHCVACMEIEVNDD